MRQLDHMLWIRGILARAMLWGLALALAISTLQESRASSRPVTVPGSHTAIDTHHWHVLYQRPGWEGGDTIDLRAAGDIMLGRLVAETATHRGFDYPFELVRPLLNGDLTIGNLESPLTDRPEGLRPGPYRLPAPAVFGAPLARAGFDALALANNHALDVGPPGLQKAAATLASNAITPLGIGPDATAARRPALLTFGKLRVALLAFNDVPDPEDQPGEGLGWGCAWLDQSAVAALGQARDRADLVVALVHWGREYQGQPSQHQRDWAGKLVAAGADLIVGSHPHVLQPVELVTAKGRTGVVAFSLGNFVFDQEWSDATSTGVVLRVLLDGQGVALVAAAPIVIVDGQPRPLVLEDPLAQQALLALEGSQALRAWSWDGYAARAVAIPSDPQLAPRPDRLAADLRGDGEPVWAMLGKQGSIEVRDGPSEDARLLWRNEAADWRITRIDAGDPNDDGRIELVLLLWRRDASGTLRSHPFLVGWRGGRYGVIWGGGATPVPIQDIAVGDLDSDGRQELVVLEGGHLPGDQADTVSIWHWYGWGFQREWRAPAPGATHLWLADLDGDHRREVIARLDKVQTHFIVGTRFSRGHFGLPDVVTTLVVQRLSND